MSENKDQVPNLSKPPVKDQVQPENVESTPQIVHPLSLQEVINEIKPEILGAMGHDKVLSYSCALVHPRFKGVVKMSLDLVHS